jgi:hypothetical protein
MCVVCQSVAIVVVVIIRAPFLLVYIIGLLKSAFIHHRLFPLLLLDFLNKAPHCISPQNQS